MNKVSILVVVLAACGSSSSSEQAAPSPSPTKETSPTTQPTKPDAPTARDATVQQMLEKGTSCEIRTNGFALDCPEYKAVGEYAFKNQGQEAVASTCGAFLANGDPKKRLLAAKCLEGMNARNATTQLGVALDAIEKEQDPVVRQQLAWGIKSAEAVTAKLDERVLAIVNKLAADPKGEATAGYLFGTLFPQYMVGSGPKAPKAAQDLALEALGRDGTNMQRTAFNSVTKIEDKPAVCAALQKMLRADAKQWSDAAGALVDLKDACAADLPKTIDFILERLATGDTSFATLERIDYVFELDEPTRARIAKALVAAQPKVKEWERKRLDKAVGIFSKPRAAKKQG